ncbi:MAG: hypothetical protein IJZ37_03045 [Clostridia bacterium]|nr:hypothetical protein [Clostridia bacterium]
MRSRKNMRLFYGAGICALAACVLLPVICVLQSAFLRQTIFESLEKGSLLSVLSHLYEQFGQAEFALVYDAGHLPGIPLLLLFYLVLAGACFKSSKREGARRRGCVLAGAGLQCYAVISFLTHIVLAVALYYKEWTQGVSSLMIFRILLTAMGSGFFELLNISVFSVLLILTGKSGKYRPIAVAAGGVCFYRLFKDSLWLFTGLFDGTLKETAPLQIWHGVFFLAAMFLVLCAAVLVAMSGGRSEEDEEDAERSTP